MPQGHEKDTQSNYLNTSIIIKNYKKTRKTLILVTK
jgi:hypothetical protein